MRHLFDINDDLKIFDMVEYRFSQEWISWLTEKK